MPELAEVERVRRLLECCALGKEIATVSLTDDELVFCGVKQAVFKRTLEGKRVKAVGRRGKVFYLEMEGVPHVSFHLAMTGRVVVDGEDTAFYYRFPAAESADGNWPPKFHKLLLTFSDGTKVE